MVLWRFKKSAATSKVLFKPDSLLTVTCQFCTYVAPRRTHDALCTAVGLASRLERIHLMSSTKQIIHAILIGFAFSTTWAAEHLVETHVAHDPVQVIGLKFQRKIEFFMFKARS